MERENEIQRLLREWRDDEIAAHGCRPETFVDAELRAGGLDGLSRTERQRIAADTPKPVYPPGRPSWSLPRPEIAEAEPFDYGARKRRWDAYAASRGF